MKVKLILPALTEAKSPYWRPIKYSLFPPLGFATPCPGTRLHQLWNAVIKAQRLDLITPLLEAVLAKLSRAGAPLGRPPVPGHAGGSGSFSARSL